MSEQLYKLIRFAKIYGWQRALNKAVARTRPTWLRNPFVLRRQAEVSLIGCGQFAFSCVCFYLQKHKGNVFLDAFDLDEKQAESLGSYYGFRNVALTPADVFGNPALRLLYVISNHASHTPYAVEGLKRGLAVYVEKPVSVSYEQFVQLSAARQSATGRLFAGYNRPYSRAIQTLREWLPAQKPGGGFSLSYFINGHVIPPDHWYRRPDEGTRVCGNLGHWIDLTVHIWSWRSLPNWIDIRIAYANPAEPDDNLCVTFTTDKQDIVSILLTARSEPFEGISESVNLQYGDLIARIDDFRSLKLWQGSRRLERRYSPKDVGHERAILQPYWTDNRDWEEVEVSTLLMLHIKDMVEAGREASRFDLFQELKRLETDVQQKALPLTV
ncbi:Gfo/Idh/MocA family oxidoreductase [Spirosoma taeanense]|uniref:Gfo/Idh/MocA family oxidoreductase n=1 Tax=Spirosoma taeanense TaxID=2735870 RepID=A0A6M5YCY4_9BACT|nr:Gfo/Idh/MocA family oxidoreductase [Spirosoma taeanense]QJW91170.1 Gfo/Idh/MocA family oxidoreductase [Spirosoma taeanense]